MVVVARRLKPATIQRRVGLLFLEAFPVIGRVAAPPVPVEDLLERHLRLHLEFADLNGLGFPGIDGAIFAEEHMVRIDERLDPVEHPEMEGRYRFTIAHEIGHWRLHRQLPDLHRYASSTDPRFVGSYTEFEWQANQFASYLLMPEPLVRREWRAAFGDSSPLPITPEMEAIGVVNFGSRSSYIGALADDAAERLAAPFMVSTSAMRIRLQGLGLIPLA